MNNKKSVITGFPQKQPSWREYAEKQGLTFNPIPVNFCYACLQIVYGEISCDPKYCQTCYGLVSADMNVKSEPDVWINHGATFITGGQKFGVSKTGATVLIEKPMIEPTHNPIDDSPNKKEPVAKFNYEEVATTNNPQAKKMGIMQHRRGRPRKTTGEKIHRTTLWRRRKKETKQEQGGNHGNTRPKKPKENHA
ncbi:hypothetical protein ACFLTW_04590 [Chloroflexota bacterium]